MKNVSLFGYGKTTQALSKLFSNVVFYDDKCIKPFTDENGLIVKPSSDFNPKYSSLEITSPGIAPTNQLILKAENLQSEYDCFIDSTPLKIWISGTNGKTTTTQMMQHLLEKKGSVAGGNIGTPLANLNQEAKIWILETSSFTMHYTNKALPNIYVLLPLSPDHLTWHGSMKEYEESKLKPIYSMKEGEVAIVPKKYANIKTNAMIISYGNEEDIASYFKIDSSKVNFHGAFLMDALLAMAMDKILFDEIDYEKINSFKLDSHRQEELKDLQNRLWVNDTKATNLDATIAAVNRYKNKFIHLILGGDDKGVNLNELFVFLAKTQLTIYAIGSNKQKLFELCNKHNINVVLCKNLEDSVKKIKKVLTTSEVALLSPSASSLDEFSSYAQRGNEFKKVALSE
jgi:UDP-N-acetylmuramoylalanine--D-glutamate ligase